jgi:hypothetical protein
MPRDEVKDGGEKIKYQLYFPKKNIDATKKRCFENVGYINPKQEFNHRYITSIPSNATFVWIQCKFLFKLGVDVKMNSQRIFRVPANEKECSNKLN